MQAGAMKVRHITRQTRPTRTARWDRTAARLRAHRRADKAAHNRLRRAFRDLMRSGMNRYAAIRAPSMWNLSRALRDRRLGLVR
jgi:hypothetical protein